MTIFYQLIVCHSARTVQCTLCCHHQSNFSNIFCSCVLPNTLQQEQEDDVDESEQDDQDSDNEDAEDGVTTGAAAGAGGARESLLNASDQKTVIDILSRYILWYFSVSVVVFQ